jgi:5-formyltetrahydrofolate cyclo-ligase
LASFVSSIDPSGPRGKLAARRTALLRRDSLPPAARDSASLAIAERASSLILAEVGTSARPSTVALYAAKGSEVAVQQLAELLVAGGWRVAYPRVVDDHRVLAFHVAREADLVPGHFGIREPSAMTEDVALDAIDVFVVPGIVFDRSGGRIGWGRGHYDATLAAAGHALRLGVAYECQIVDHVPVDVHDVRLHGVITEQTIYRMTS